VHWYASMLSTTWFLAHVVALTFVVLGITLCLDGERRERMRARFDALAGAGATHGRRGGAVSLFQESSLFLAWYRRLRQQIDPMQFMAGFVFGIGALARLPVIFGAPFFLFVGGGGTFFRRGLSAGLGAAIPVGLLLLYTFVATGHLFNPAYEHLYQTEYLGYLPPETGSCLFPRSICDSLTINRDLAIEDIGHVPVNLAIMLAWLPVFDADCVTSLLRPECAVLKPDQIGMSVLLTSPAYLLAIPLALANWRKRIVLGSLLAVGAIAFINLMHFSQGWVQFGYRFSNDFAPFALVLVTLAIASMRKRMGLAIALVAASIIINAWGVYWGVVLGW
ncbi:MAG TPA: hypothetical protein VMZ33_01535, partial [Candidatus Limnocylindrales bacterium]|nr:hypothetical protein [Candidatus Limnocylindrales bacterium]